MTHEPLVTITLLQYEDMRRSIKSAHEFMRDNKSIVRLYYAGTHTGIATYDENSTIVDLIREIERLRDQLKQQQKKKSWF